jgi:hypothetical protein
MDIQNSSDFSIYFAKIPKLADDNKHGMASRFFVCS